MTWQPTWRRLIASTLVLFALVLAVLVWRIEAGDDPALGATRPAGASNGSSTGVVPTPDAADPGLAPGGGVAPDDGTGSGAGGGQGFPGSQQQQPDLGGGPSTHQS